MVDFVECVAAESARFQRAVETIAAESAEHSLASVAVPPCPDWTAADLVWHLAEVQYFWACIVEGNLANPGAVEPLVRPADDELLELMAAQSSHLVNRLETRNPGEPCWSWHDEGHSVGWVRRRQAHEALIHRVDAELTLEQIKPGSLSAIDEDLAADGVDEMMTVMLDLGPIPDWGKFEAGGATARIEVPGRSWWGEFGRFLGTEPDGDHYDREVLRLIEPVAEPSATISGGASEMDLWLWRRGDLGPASFQGDSTIVDRLQALAAVE
ncbi:MAG: maleylpyruvate isomerase family mycothiol-dependent enzyme [Acidimicrobiales bacterium]